ncbi:hypothetical protein [Methylorubrum salsuginis]|uniref:Uncharacterized protein n=1 Tax=Methylorubrum salsuginis TaxID=414703 RepID=A0A1I4N3K1_9HYPH|nr:hypothetical protein [Methylorubrum salsuginis]SFM09820.1 hypothetical protein SAMN04488125_1533 [Methylorubrum salsuginis]
MLKQAVTLTDEARTTARIGDDVSRARGAGLHAVAADLRREAGDWGSCAENFVALARYYVRIGRTAAVEEYVRKALFVSEFLPRDEDRARVHLSAALATQRIGKLAEATNIAFRAKTVVGLCRDRYLAARIGRAHKRVKGALGAWQDAAPVPASPDVASTKPYAWEHVPPPVEFRIRPIVTWRRVKAGAPGYAGMQHDAGIDLLMQRPGAAGECRCWVSHRVVDGVHEFVAFPNWSGRAMQAAKAMHNLTKDVAGTDGPSTVVMQACSALEAFINSVVHFIRNGNEERWSGSPIRKILDQECKNYKDRVPTLRLWGIVPAALFGGEWKPDVLPKDLRNLFDLRDQLLHFKGDNEEVVGADGYARHFIGHFKFDPFAPGPWVDKVLTRECAEWAISVAERMIWSFRKAWIMEAARIPGNEAFAHEADDPDGTFDPQEDVPDEELLRAQEENLAEFLRRCRERERVVSGLVEVLPAA